jgi:Domain of unknown function (DUF5679)/von Willebrand factor type A domain
VTRWLSSPFRPRRRGSPARLTLSSAVGFALLSLWWFHPAAAAEDALDVIAVHTASAAQVSIVVEAPAALRGQALTSGEFSVTVDGESVATTVTPMASNELSVALVIDTGSNMNPEELAAVQSAATEHLLRLPADAHTAVVDAGDHARMVAPLSPEHSHALSALSALRTEVSSSAAAGVLLAAETLQAAPPGPRAIIVYSRGVDEHGVLVEKLSQAILQSQAVLYVLLAGADPVWEWVVDRAGGTVVHTDASQVVQSYADLATALSDQYLLAFKARGDMPTGADVVLQTAGHEYRRVVLLPEINTATGQSSQLSTAESTFRLLAILTGIALAMLSVAVYLRHARRPPAALSAEPSAEVADLAVGAPPPDPAIPTALQGVSAASPQRPPKRASLSAAVHGRRLAQHAIHPDRETESPRQRPNNGTPHYEPDNRRASLPVSKHLTTAAINSEAYSGEFYCVKCKAKRNATGQVVVNDKGTRMAKATCPVCETKLNRILGRA